MKRNLTLTLIFLLFGLIGLHAQCNNPNGFDYPAPPGTSSCEAVSFCNGEINGYCGQLGATNVTWPSPLCGGNGVPNNMEWLAFVAAVPSMTITITPFNCPGAGGVTGVQAGLYTACEDDAGSPVPGACESNCQAAPFTLNANNLVVGNVYYLFIDGCAGDQCSYTIATNPANATALPPIGTLGTISGYTNVCPGASNIQYSVPLLFSAVGYTWTVPAGWSFTQSGNSIIIDFPANATDGQICVEAFNDCFMSNQVCLDINLSPPPVGADNGEYCQGSTYLYPGDDQNYTDGFYTITLFGENWLGCDSMVNLNVVELSHTEEFIEAAVCFGDSYEVCGIPYDFENQYEIDCNPNFVGCDSTIILDLYVLEPIADVEPPALLGCGANDCIYLDAFSSFGDEFLWETANGIIDDDPTSLFLEICFPGTYCLTATSIYNYNSGAQLSCTDQVCVTVMENAVPPNTNFTSTPAGCPGQSNGTATITVSNPAIGPFTYTWVPQVSISNTATNLGVGTYNVTITAQSNGCTSTEQIMISASPPITIGTSQTNVACNGGSTGTATATPGGGSGSYTYNWCNGQTSQTATSLPVGTCSVTVTSGGCTNTASVTITQATAMAVSIVPANVACNGGTTGSATASASGGTGPYTYLWSNSQTGATATNLAAGSYTVTATDALGCTSVQNTTLVSPPAITLTTTQTNLLCNGNTNGTATANPGGGVGGFTYNWCNGQTTATATGLPTGPCQVTVTDGNGCTAAATVTITAPNPVSVSATSTNVNCFGVSDGTATATVSGGTGSPSYQWCNGQSTATATGLGVGACGVTVTDGNGCTAVTSVTLTGPATALSVSGTSTNASCGSNNGTVSITVSGGTPSYTYAWSNSSTTQNITNVGPGGYTVTVTDNNDCTAVFSTTVNTPSGLQATTSATPVSCNGGSNGSVSVTVSGGSAPFSYAWTGGIPANQTTGTNLAAGNYNVTVTDGSGCTFVSSATVAQPTSITIAGNSTDENCGEGDGTISTNVQGGSGPYQYAWAPSGTGANPTGLSAGNYSLTVTDANSCTATFSVPVNTPGALLVNAVGTNADCNGEASGSIATTVTGGTGPYDYAWTGGLGGTEDPNNVAAGTYNLVVTDDTGCSVTTSVTIAQPTVLAATNISNQATCGGANGSISITVTGGTTPYSYDWSNNNTTSNPNNLTAGNYTVTITDGNDCELIQSITVTTPPPLALTIASTMTSCFNGTNGSINLGVTGGTVPYTYAWTGGAIVQDPGNLAAGMYSVVVTDNNDCTATISVQVGQPTVLTYQATSTSASCGLANGTISSLASGGTPGYTYAWSGGASNTQNPNNLSPGSYVGTVTDANGCTATTSEDVLTPAGLSSNNTVTEVSCNGESDGAINLTVSGGVSPFTYQWDYNGLTTQDLNNLPAGDYGVVITDATGCTIVASATVTQPNAIVVTSAIIEASCGEANGGISLTVIGGSTPYTYTWSNAATNQNPTGLLAGTYMVTVSDANDCETIESVVVTEPNAPQLTATATMASCFGGADGSVDLQVSGGVAPFQYAWTGGSILQDPNNLAAGIYNAIVTDNTGCSATISVEIEQPQELIVSGNAVDALCGEANGAITSSTIGGTAPYSYAWSGGAAAVPNPGGLFPGTYVATVTDGNGCTTTFSIDVETPTGLSLTTSVTDVACNGAIGGAVDLVVSGGVAPFNYLWDYNNLNVADLANIPAGNYSVTVTDATGCTIIASALVNEPAAIALSETIIEATCGDPNGGISLSVIGGTAPYSYEWSNGAINQNPTGLLAGDYDVIVTDANDCTATLSITVTTPNALTATATQSNVSCNGGSDGSVNITVQGGTAPYTYLWNGSITAEDPTGLSAGAVTGVVTDANGCEASVTMTLQEPEAIVLDATTEDATCGEANGSINLTVSGGTSPYTYDWDNAPDVQNPGAVLTGSYTVVVTDINGCTESYTTVVNTPNALVLSAAVTDADCNGASTGSINLTVSGGVAPFTYDWPGWNGEDLSNVAAGSYTVIVTDATDCSVSLTEIVNEPTVMALSGTSTVALCGQNNGTINLTVSGGTNPYTYEWSNGDINEDPINLGIGNYTVIVTDANQCTAVEAIVVSTPNGLALTSASTDVSCNGGADGTASVSPSGGTPPFTYLWSNGQTTPGINGLSIGTVTCTVTDSDGCEVVSSSVIAEPTQININGNSTQATCGNANGTVTIAVSGGTSPYTYAWSNGSTNQNPTQLLAGLVTVTVTDANSCTMEASFTVGTPQALTGALTPSNVSCNGGFDGSISPAIFGGVGPYDYLWTPGGSTMQIPTDLSAGVYTLLVTDANGCTLSLQQALSEPAALDVSGTSTNALCGESDGTVDITVTGGTTPYSYVWSNGPTTPDLPGVAAGSYTVTVTDANDCEFIYQIAVNTPSMLVASADGVDALCFGSSNGMASSTVTGGSAPFTYEWSNGDQTEDLLDVTAGNYILSVTDATGCTVTASVTIGEPTVLSATGESTDAECNQDNGTITITVNGGTTPYNFEWPDGTTTQNIINLSTGSYTVTITDDNGCTYALTQSVSTPGQVTVTESVSDASCDGDSDGAIVLTLTGGTGPFGFAWDNNAITQNVSGLPAGYYIVTVTDGIGCTSEYTYEVMAPAALVVTTLTPSDVSCYGETNGGLTLTVAGGTMPYTYQWSTNSTADELTNVGAGLYTVTVTDNNDCTATTSATVEEPTELSFTTTANETNCSDSADGEISATVTGGTMPYTYGWSNGSTAENLTGLSSGVYVGTVTDDNGCTSTVTQEVAAPTAVALSIGAVSDYAGVNVSCSNSSDGFATVQPSGGLPPFTFEWSNGDTDVTAENLGAGSYTVTATDANGCPGETIVTLEGPDPLFVATVARGVTCYGDANGVILVDSIGGGATPFMYALNGGDFNQHGLFANLLPGSYELLVQDANGCEEVFTQTVESAPELQVFINGDTSIRLGEQTAITATFNVLDASTLQQSGWVNGSFWLPDADGMLCDSCLTRDIRPLETTTYEYLIVDEDGCIGRDELIVRVLKDRAVYIPNAFSPNGDNNNEYLLVYPGPEVANINFFKIYNRWGEVVYELSDFFAMAPDEGWDGRFKGDMMNPGVFVYHAQVVFWDGRVELLKGDITLFR